MYKRQTSDCLIQTVDKVYPIGDDSDYMRAACLSVIASEVEKAVGPNFKIGAQLMWSCITPSLAVAKPVQTDFTRCIALVGQTTSPFGGVINADSLKVLECRKKIDMESVNLLAEITGYHSHGNYDKEALLSRVASTIMVWVDTVEVMSRDEEINNRMERDIRGTYPNPLIILEGGTNVASARNRLRSMDDILADRYFEGENWGEGIDENIIVTYMEEVRSI